MAETKLNNWKKNKRHQVTLPSGAEVTIQIPNLPLLAKAGQVPNKLLEIVLGAQKPDFQVTPEMLGDQSEFAAFLVTHTVVDPVVTDADVAELPYEDVEMVMDFALRNRDFDAVGKHIAGLEKIESFRRFRGLDTGYEDAAGL